MKSNYINLGKIIKEKRKSQKITLQEISDYLGVDMTMLSKIENGKKALPQKHIKKLSRILGMSEEDLQSLAIAEEMFERYGDNGSFKMALQRATSIVK